ncbi:MAG: peptidoglycan DD-metalloendopeptidase family protein [Clostridia bacterium]|nr:peptidoglycan DD-metalloendopeptidase family protein [Clostridia bacterium]
MQFKRFGIKTLVALMMAAFCLLQTPIANFDAGAASLQQQLQDNLKEQSKIKNEISKLKKDKNAAQAVANGYQKQVSNVQSRISICNKLINQYNEEMNKLESEIAAKNEEIADTKELFKKRLRAIQMSGDTATLTLLLGADNLADFLSKAQMAKNVSNYDQKIIDELTEAIKKIEADQKVIEEKQAEQKDISAELASAQKEYTSLLNDAKEEVNEVNSDLKQQQNLLKKYEEAEAELEESLREAASYDTGNLVMTSLNFTWPVPGASRISSPYGYRIHPVYGYRKFHKGIDIPAAAGKPIVASAAGVVSAVKSTSSGYGNHVIINHGEATNGNSYQTLYAHMTRYIVKKGQSVQKGQVIGYVGSTGTSTGNHLHFEVRIKKPGEKSYAHTNPANYVRYGK